MAKIRNDIHPIDQWYLDWVVTGRHSVDSPGAPYRDFHTVLYAERSFFPGGCLDSWGFILTYDREKAEALAYSLVANPALISDICTYCHWPYYRGTIPRWNDAQRLPPPTRYFTWPDTHQGVVPACISWDYTWQWEPYPPYPWE